MDYWVSEIRKLEDRSGTLAIINPVKYEEVNLHLLKKYVDDCIVAMDTLRAGTRWSKVEKAMVWSQETQDLDTHQGKVRQVNSMEQVALMASDIVSCLKFTNDCPQINSEGTMAVLDTQMWTGQEARQTGIPRDMLEDKDLIKTKMGPLREIVLYKFYQKPMANRVGNRKASAAPEQQKVSTTSQEFLRRLKNTSRDLPPEVIEEVIMTYMEELQEGGYTEDWRLEVLESAIKGYERIWKSEVEGTGAVNRPEGNTRLKRRWEKLCGKQNWFKGKNKVEEQGTQRTKRKKRSQ